MLELDREALALAALGFAALATLWLATAWFRARPKSGDESSRRDRIASAHTDRSRHSTGPAPVRTASGPRPVQHKPRPAPPTPSPKVAAFRHTPPPFGGRAWVVDGDTIKVASHRIRLFGMDAPEMDQDGGAQAKSALIKLCGKRSVKVEPLCFDMHDRIVAKVWLGDTDLSEHMVRAGFAVAMSRWHRDYLPAERDARAARRGLWAECPETGIRDPAAHRAEKRRTECGSSADPPRRSGLV